MIKNFISDGTSTFKVSVKENDMAYGTVHNLVLMADNPIYETVADQVPVHENVAYVSMGSRICTNLNGDGPVYDHVD